MRTYQATVLSGDGTFAGSLLTIPISAGSIARPEGVLEDLAAEFEFQIGTRIDPEFLDSLLEQIAFEAAPKGIARYDAVQEVFSQMAHEPVVVLEESPAVGKTLSALLSQGGVGVIALAGGSPFLMIVYEGVLLVGWFFAGPVKGAREGFTEAAHDAAKEVGTEVFREWFHKAFRRRRR